MTSFLDHDNGVGGPIACYALKRFPPPFVITGSSNHETPVLIQAGFEITFSCAVPTPMHLQVHVRPEREVDLLAPEQLVANPFTPYRTYIDSFGNRCTRIMLPAGTTTLSNLFTIRDSGIQETLPWGATQSAVE